MEIRITAKQEKSNFTQKGSVVTNFKEKSKERYFPLLELMVKELENQMRNERK